jgi:DNA repair exonuclease SbcCD ATPase subunit
MRARARDFLSWAEFDRDLGQGVTLIQGFNFDDGTEEGCGKSAVPNILSWGIYGEIPKEALIDDVIREGAKGCETEIYLDGFSVFRSRAPNDLHIKFANGKIFRGADARETQKEIIKLVGMTFATFCQSIYFAQNFPMKFVIANQENKGKILSEILNLGQFDRARKNVADIAKDVKEEHTGAMSKYAVAAGQASFQAQNILTFESMIEEFNAEKKERIQKLLQSHSRLLTEARNAEVEFNAEKAHKIKEQNEIIAEAKTAIKTLRDEIHRLKTLIWEEQKPADFAGAKAEIEEKLEAINAIREDAKFKLGSLEAEIRAFNKAKRDIDSRKADLEKLDFRIDQKKKTIKHEKAIFEISQNELITAIQARDNPSKENCPTCGQPWEGDLQHYEKEVSKAQKSVQNVSASLDRQEEELEQWKSDQTQLQSQISAMKADLREPKSSNAKLEDIVFQAAKDAKEAKAAIREIEELEKRAGAVQTSLALAEDRLKDAERQERTALSEREECKDLSPHRILEKYEAKQRELEAEIEAEDAKEPTSIEEKLGKARKAAESAEKEAQTLKAKADALAARLVRLESLREGYREVKAYTFENTLRQLNSKANKYLSQLFNQRVKIQFKNEDLKIETAVEIDGVKRTIGLYSGGQFRRIALAVDLALADVTLARKGNQLNIMIMDEYFKDLSATSMKRILKILQARKTPTLLIEHNDLFKQIVDQTLEVEYRGGISKVV